MNFSWIVLLSCIILFGLVTYRLANPNLSNEQKKQLYYGQIITSFFASTMILFFMSMFAIGSFNFIRRGQLDKLHFFLWSIFYIITSPFSLTIIQYSFKDMLDEKYLSIGILLSTIVSVIFPLNMIKPSLFKSTLALII